MRKTLRTIFLKSLPYLMSITGGVILYTGAIDNAPTANLRDLIIKIFYHFCCKMSNGFAKELYTKIAF